MDSPPATNIHTIVKAQIVFLLSTLTEENFERNQLEIRSLSEQHGVDTYLHFIRRLIVHSQARLQPSPPSSAFDSSISLTFRLLVQETQRLARDPFLADRFRDGVGGGEGDSFRNFDLARFVDRVGLRSLERLVLAAAIVGGQTRKELTTQAVGVIRTEFDNAIPELCQSPPSEHAEFTLAQMSKFLSNLLVDHSQDAPLLEVCQRQALLIAAQAKLGNEAMAPIMQHLYSKLNIPSQSSLVEVLISLGPELTSDPEAVKGLLERFGITSTNPPRDTQVVELMSTLARLAAEGSVMCDVGALVRALSSFDINLNWASVIKSFDWADWHGVDTASLKMLIAILLNSPRNAEPHAVTGFWETWSNSLHQLRLLDALLSLPADTFNFVQLPGHRIVTVDDVSIASPTIKSLAANVQGQTWNSLELFQMLVRHADSESPEIRNCVREMLDKAIKISAEIVHMGLLQVPEPTWNDIRSEYSNKLLAMFLAGHPNHQLVFMRIWQIQPEYLKTAFYNFYDENPLNITRILDVAQDLKILDSLLEVRPFIFALDVAALASRREYLNLDKWLADNVVAYREEFLHSVIEFLRQKMESEKAGRLADPPIEGRTMSLNPTTITIVLRVLRNNSNMLSPEHLEQCIEVRNLCLQIHPRLMSLHPNTDVEPGLTVITYSNEIESEVDGIYKQMYDENTTIDEVIAMLQRYKESNNLRDQELFSCMIHFLFDEYKFFQSYYPARELAMTGYLFGSLIRHSLIDHIPLGIAMRYILDALHCHPDTNLFKFGTQALSRFEVRLHDWRPLCEALSEISHLAEARPDLMASIHRALVMPAGPEANPPDAQLLNPNGQYEVITTFTAIQPDPIAEQLEAPPEELSDKILFIVNNLAPTNFDSKVKEMREQFVDQYSRWFANYLVDQRISTEPNNHPLYLRFLDALDRRPLSKMILQETFLKASALLNSERSVAGSDRNALKNVGTWLGAITLARDQPIKHKNLAFKDLLIEGYDSNRLIVAIPFVCKTLEPCSKSRVFKPPNPWLMAVVSLLAELYHFAELKLNLKFDIEILCKSLAIDLDAVEPATILRNRPLEMTGMSLPEYTGDIGMLPMGGDNAAAQLADSQVLVLGSQGPTEVHRALGAHIEAILANLVHLVHIGPQLAPFHINPNFKRAVQLAVDRAVREIILPVVERSVTIAGISTRELVAKDFATELNEEKVRRAGHLMAQTLAGSLALVTCKEPLKSNLASHLRQHLVEHGFNEQMIPEPAIALIVQDNLDVACSAIEKAAMERSVSDVDDGFTQAYESRRRHRELRSVQGFWDPSVPPSNFSSTLPDPLRIKSTGIQAHQMIVYEDFVVDPRSHTDSRPGSVASFHTPVPYSQSPSIEDAHAHTLQSHQDAMDRFMGLTRDLEAVVLQYPTQALATLPSNHDIRHLVRQIILLADEARDRERTPLMMSQKIVQLLYKTTSPLGREVYVAILDQLCRNFENVAKEAITWLLYAEDERKFNVLVTVTLLRSGLVNITLQDQQLAKLLFEDARPILMNFTANLIRQCLSTDPPVATQGQFVFSLEMLNQLEQAGKATEEVSRLLDDLRGIRRNQKTEQLREKLFECFQQWIAIFQCSASPEKNFVLFITKLTKEGILKMEDVSSFFFRVCAESSVNSYIKCMAAGNYDYAFLALDAMSRLIVYIIKYHGDASGVNNDQAKVHYLTKILSIFVLVLANLHEEQGPNFQQKPFFRFFSSLVNDLHGIESHLGPVYFQLLISISDTYSSLQPTYFPGFAFSWMSLISHRLFMPKLLLSENREGWSAFHKLLLSLFKFMHPLLKDADLQTAGRDLYRGTLRLLLVLLHDFPEFLSEYYFSLCDAIPQRCIQLRNIILSAFPPAIVLPDPNLRNVKFEAIPEMGPIPPFVPDFAAGLKSGDLKVYLDQYLLNRGSSSFLPSLTDRLKLQGNDSEEVYNLSLINSLVMYIGVSSVAQVKARSGTSPFVVSDPGVVALQFLAMNLDVEGQHHLLSAMVLHLRYPNAHTHWFSCLLLHLFHEINDERFREVVTKVLLERFIVHRPHPWGALVTFIELLRNQKYDFWNREFVQIAPEVTTLLESIGRSIFQQ